MQKFSVFLYLQVVIGHCRVCIMSAIYSWIPTYVSSMNCRSLVSTKCHVKFEFTTWQSAIYNYIPQNLAGSKGVSPSWGRGMGQPRRRSGGAAVYHVSVRWPPSKRCRTSWMKICSWMIEFSVSSGLPTTCSSCIYTWTINKLYFPEICLDVMQSHPLCRMCFGQHMTQ